jgi:hypothetical protein
MSPTVRLWRLLGLAAALAALAVWRMQTAEQDLTTVIAPTVRRAPTTQPAVRKPSSTASPLEVTLELPLRAAWQDDEASGDPFAARSIPRARPVAAPAQPEPQRILAEPTAPPPPPPVPTLPYRYLGKIAEPDGKDARVFLLLGEQVLIARAGDTLEGGWRLAAIQPQLLRFERPSDHLPLTLATDGH